MKLNALTKFVFASSLVLASTSCQKEDEQNAKKDPVNTDFKYETTITSGITIQAPSYLANATFGLYTDNPELGGKLLTHGKLDESGQFQLNYILPKSLGKVYLKSTYVGLPDSEVEVVNGNVNFDYTTSGLRSSSRSSVAPSSASAGNITYNYLGAYNSAGVPNYLTNPDIIDQGLLTVINNSLPENDPVPVSNPHYLSNFNQTDLILNHAGDVWITFLHEGAGAKNTFGYYTYDLQNPPQTEADIDVINIVLPNASASGSGGGLVAGDKVYLGNFPANTGIGWVLLQNAWNGSSVDVNKKRFYSNQDFNRENVTSKRQHFVQLVDNTREIIIVGIEDILRTSNSDEDFNDLVFYVSVDPWNAVDLDGIPDVDEDGDDEDGDGVPDYADDYPDDPDKAFDNYTPFEGEFSSYAFEDLWPNKGDYDFNDLIVNTNYNHITNANGQITEMVYKLKVAHIGASFANGFGIEWPFAPNYIESITGIPYTYANNDVNGTELGQQNAVMIAYPNAFDAEGEDVMEVTIKMATPFHINDLMGAGLNPFIYADQDRGREIHLMDHEPTSLMNHSYFGQGDDQTMDNLGLYYRSTTGQPWGIYVSHAYKAPTEKVAIWNGYLKFNDWVNSFGQQYNDWYEDQPGYRNNSYIQN